MGIIYLKEGFHIHVPMNIYLHISNLIDL